MRRFLALAILLSAAACGAPAEDATDSTPQDWIEVPLADHVFRDMPAGYRQDTLDVEVPPGPGLEVKLAMREGDALVYTWVAEGLDDPSQLLSEFHGHTEREPGEPGTLMFYRKATGDREHGSLVAPFDGIHGWYYRNDTDMPIVVRLSVSGFYELTGS
jgi:hypothetical protein